MNQPEPTEQIGFETTTAQPTTPDTNRHELRLLHLLAGVFFAGCTVVWLLAAATDSVDAQVFAVVAAATVSVAGVAALLVMVRRAQGSR